LHSTVSHALHDAITKLECAGLIDARHDLKLLPRLGHTMLTATPES
jgi:hypothetical protein